MKARTPPSQTAQLQTQTIMMSSETEVSPRKAADDKEDGQCFPLFLHHLTKGLTGTSVKEGAGQPWRLGTEAGQPWGLRSLQGQYKATSI